MSRWLLIAALVPVVLAAYIVLASAVGAWLRSRDPLADAREPMSEGYSEALAEWDRRCAEWEARQRDPP